ncbi:hypothetical protein RB195_007836 [Necator americanus]|uniref:Uncharacterized protein n=1 Tax=Necator americanus TaxID=51031 RepID=A0ABR1C1S8_NECAM
MSSSTSPAPSMSFDERRDREEVSSTSSSPATSMCAYSETEHQHDMGISAFRSVSGIPVTMQQRLLAMLQNEIPQPFASTHDEPCITTTTDHDSSSKRSEKDILEKENVQLRAQIALLRLEVSQLSLVLLAEGTKPLS